MSVCRSVHTLDGCGVCLEEVEVVLIVIDCCCHRNKEIFRKAEEDGVGVLNFKEALKVRIGHIGGGACRGGAHKSRVQEND